MRGPRCTCFPGSYYEPPEQDPYCPWHGFDEETGEPIDPPDEADFTDPEYNDSFDPDPYGWD